MPKHLEVITSNVLAFSTLSLPSFNSTYVMAQQSVTLPNQEWKPFERIAFRFFSIYFLIQILPLDWKFWKALVSINWLDVHFKQLFDLAHYFPKFFSEDISSPYGLSAFADWIVFFVVAALGTLIWSIYDKKTKEYNQQYYLLRVVLRYRLAIALIAFGFIKLFPMQMPYPSLSNLHTNYGDFFAWKIYFHTVGIAPNYQSFLGFIEILAGLLLFYRRTVTFGAGLIIGFIGNVAFANGSYDAGDLAYSSFLVLIALFLFIYDVPRLYRLLAVEKPTLANRFQPVWSSNNVLWIRRGLRVSFLVVVFIYGYKTYANYTTAPYILPETPGLKTSYGFYNVREFVLGKDTLAYSLTNPNRWQDVVFEKWSTISIRSSRPVRIDVSNGDGLHEADIDRNYESAGVAGRHYYYYEADTVGNTLSLQNKNPNHRSEKLFLNYSWKTDSTLVLHGVNENSDSIHVVLDRVNKKYMMFEGRRKPVKL
jgi:hypothetical protein